MANPEHLKVVRNGAEAIRKWRSINTVRLDLSGARLQGTNLKGADLGNADLNQARLRGAILQDAVLVQAKLVLANLSRANLSGADLTSASLRAADLTDANCSHANLTNTDFTNAVIASTQLTGANLRNAKFSSTSICNADLSSIRGLETVSHFGPSELGIHTLYKSDGRIPDIFLRGCGVPEEFIAYKSSFVGSAIEFYSCFISYSHKDKAFARRLHDALQGRGIRCWLDEKQLLPGDNIYDQVDRGIRMWDKTLLCASKHSLTSAWVDDELKHAFAKEKDLFRRDKKEVKALIPLNLDGYLFKWQHPKKNLVMERLAPDFTNWKRNSDKFDEQLEQVIKALRTDDGGRGPAPTPKL